MSEYSATFETIFMTNLRRYHSLRRQIQRRVDRIIANPYHNTELLADSTTGTNLLGCRSARVDRNFRIVFAICEECRLVAACQYCYCDGKPDKTIVFLTVGPHDRAYAME